MLKITCKEHSWCMTNVHLSQYVLSNYHIPRAVLSTKNTANKKSNIVPDIMEPPFECRTCRTVNTISYGSIQYTCY